MANTFYEIVFGSGTAWCYRYIVATDYPTTDYQALVDALIDYGAENGYNFVLDGAEWDMDDDGVIRNAKGTEYDPDQYITGGNYGDALVHYGELRINQIEESDIGDVEVIYID